MNMNKDKRSENQVDKFKYLEYILQEDGIFEEDVEYRIKRGWVVQRYTPKTMIYHDIILINYIVYKPEMIYRFE